MFLSGPEYETVTVMQPTWARVWEPDALGGVGGFKFKKIFRPVKKLVKKAAKVVKKAAPLVAAGAAIYFGAPWAAKLAAKVGPAIAQSVISRAAQSGQLPPPSSPAVMSSEIPPGVLQMAQQYLPQQSLPALMPSGFAPGSAQYIDADSTGRDGPGARTGPTMPRWVLPVGIGAGVLVLGGGLYLAARR